jgi:glycosyltransferase involved in cell wall biosynthesis
MMDTLGHVVFSIIIPTKNEEKQISQCLEKIYQQDTDLPFEVIIVDSSSTEGTHDIGKTFNAIVIEEPHLGKGIAVHSGARTAKGSILCFTEADCRVPPNWLTVIHNEFKSNPDTVAVVGDYDYHDSTWFYNLLLKIALSLSIWFFYLFYKNHSIRGTNFAVRASSYKQAGEFSLQAKEFQDVEFGLRLRKFGKIRFVSSMKIKTSARRVQGRLFRFIKEFIPPNYKLIILKQVPTEATY